MDFITIPTYGDRQDTHHKCTKCGEWCPKWQQLCICHPDYAKESTRKMNERTRKA